MALSVATIEAAITDVLANGQTVMVDGVQVTRANIAHLYNLLADARKQEAITSGTRRRCKTLNLSVTGY